MAEHDGASDRVEFVCLDVRSICISPSCGTGQAIVVWTIVEAYQVNGAGGGSVERLRLGGTPQSQGIVDPSA